MSVLSSMDNAVTIDIEEIAGKNAMPKSANVILLGAAAGYLGILSPEQLAESIRNVFAPKGERIVEMNLRAFETGREYGRRQ